ncbi:MAG: hypothetical protein K2Z81_09525 [Cyanobacteria bacterium]|nr:hypothetical protein [Cyanobacteriota bacterium]
MNEYYPEDLPPEAVEMVKSTDDAIKLIKEDCSSRIEEIRERMDLEIKEIRQGMEQKIKLENQHLADRLKPIMEQYAKEGKFDEALAIRAKLKESKSKSSNVRPDPGTLTEYECEINNTFLFDVVGDKYGIVWGSDVYTADSQLSTAAVHAGLLRDGQRGIIRAEIVDMTGLVTIGTHQNDVISSDWGPYPFGYKLSKA